MKRLSGYFQAQVFALFVKFSQMELTKCLGTCQNIRAGHKHKTYTSSQFPVIKLPTVKTPKLQIYVLNSMDIQVSHSYCSMESCSNGKNLFIDGEVW